MKYTTKNGYILLLRKVTPFIFHDLQQKYNIRRPPFRYKYHVMDTGVDLEFEYQPPKGEPPKTDYHEWQLYQQWKVWRSDYDADYERYVIARNKLLLLRGVKILGKSDNSAWLDDMHSGEWRYDLETAGILVTPKNERLLFIKVEVLKHEIDYMNVLNKITVEEVTMADIFNAFDYFLAVLARHPSIPNSSELSGWGHQLITQLLGEQDRSSSEHATDEMVSAI